MENKDSIELRKFCVEIAFKIAYEGDGICQSEEIIEVAKSIESYLISK